MLERLFAVDKHVRKGRLMKHMFQAKDLFRKDLMQAKYASFEFDIKASGSSRRGSSSEALLVLEIKNLKAFCLQSLVNVKL